MKSFSEIELCYLKRIIDGRLQDCSSLFSRYDSRSYDLAFCRKKASLEVEILSLQHVKQEVDAALARLSF